MKKNFVYAMMSAIALTGAVSLTSCSSNEEVVENNPTFDGKSLRTDFAFNISKASQTRMGADKVQETGTFSFRGMSHMYLFPFHNEPGTATETNTGANFALGSLNNSSDITSAKSSKVYSLTLPVGTDNFLFYGTATRGTETNFEAGRLSSSFYNYEGDKLPAADAIKDISDISFSLVTIKSSLGGDATKIANYLTAIANTEGWAETVGIVRDHTQENSGAYSSLADLYQKFTSNTTDRCGSSEAVVRTVLDLYRSAARINGESQVTAVSTIAARICNVINTAVDGVKVTVTASNDNPDLWTAEMTGANAAFPTNLGLPMGAAHLFYTTEGTKKFSYINPNTISTATTAGVPFENICYPSELVYFDNSPLRATDKYKKESDYPITTTNWDTFNESVTGNGGFNSTEWVDTEVKASTRAVAMTNNVNYGVALLQTRVKLSGSSTTLTDNRKAIIGDDDQTNIEGAQFKVTGLLIGGQPATVNWNMINGGDDFAKVIYDNAITFKETALNNSFSSENYTIVLDNFKTGTTQPDVNFALQLTNGDQDFYGKNGMIPAGQTFYLLGTLALSSNSESWARKHYNAHPTYRITEEGTKRVFVQDYKTIANITIDCDKALKNAYSTIPDLRSTETVFGLSVDLSWEAGLLFNVTVE